MYPSYSVLFTFGIIQLHVQRSVAACPPSNITPEIVQFCGDFNISSSDIYIDSSDASTRITNCSCRFMVSDPTLVHIDTTNNRTNDCRTLIFHGSETFNPVKGCGKIDAVIQTKPGRTYFLEITIQETNLKSYCLHLFSENKSVKIELKCLKDSPIITTETTSTEPVKTTKENTAIISTSGVNSTDITTAQTTVQRSSTSTVKTYANTNENQDVPIHILAPAAGGGVLLVIGIIILSIVCSRRKNRHDYDEPGPKTDSHGYINQSIVTDVDDDEDDEMRVNYLYRSIDSEPQDDEFAGGYAEINSSGASHSRKSAASINKGEKIYSVPSNRPLTQVQGGDVYSMPVKKPKNRQDEINDTPVYSMPDKDKNKQNQETGPVYAIVDKKNDYGNSKTDKNKTNISKPAIKKKPPAIAPKPTGVNSGGDKKRKGNLNSDRLNYSEIELNVSSNNTNRSNFNVSEKTGYAEVL